MSELNYPDLQPGEWKDLLALMLRQAAFGVSTGRWSGHRPDKDWVTRKSEELAHLSVKKIISGERRWNRDKYPAFIDFAKAAVDSEVSNAKRHSMNTISKEAIDGDDPNQAHFLATESTSPEQKAVDENMKQAILRVVADDLEVRDLIEVVLELGAVKRRELIDYLDLDSKSYDTLRRRAQRRLKAAGFDLKVLWGLVAWEGHCDR